MWGVKRVSTLEAKEELAEDDPEEVRVWMGVSCSLEMLTRRPKVDSERRRSLNWETSSLEAVWEENCVSDNAVACDDGDG